MSYRLFRAQILLEPEQHQALSRIAQRNHKSISEVVRDVLRLYLEEQQLAKELLLLDEMNAFRKRIRERGGVYNGDLLNEIREERDADNVDVTGLETGDDRR